MDKRYGQKLNEKDIVGKSNGCLTVLSLNDIQQVNCNGHKCWEYIIEVRCESCGKIFNTTWKNFRARSRANCKSCKYCKGALIMDNQTKRTGFTQKERLRISAIKSGAKKRNIPYNLSDEEVVSIISQPCVYCKQKYANGIDRIDSMKGYEKENVVPCCAICNRMKNNYSLDFFKAHIKKIYKTFYENQEL